MLRGGINESMKKYTKLMDKKAIKESKNDQTTNSTRSNKKSTKKMYKLNILYYDENLNDKGENSDNCCFLSLNTEGTFYGCHNFELFKLVLSKINKLKKEFVLIVSGSSADKIINYCLNNIYILEKYIFIVISKKNIYF